jgi:hypothetical protein
MNVHRKEQQSIVKFDFDFFFQIFSIKKPTMSSTVISRCSITLHDVSTQVTERSVSKLITKILPNVRISKINLGDPFCEYLVYN